MAKYHVQLYGDVNVEAKSAKDAIKLAQGKKPAKWRSYRYQCEDKPVEPLSAFQQLKKWWKYNFVLPVRALRGVITVGQVMDERLLDESKVANKLQQRVQAQAEIHVSSLQFHLDRIADENSELKKLLSKAIKLGFDPDTVPDSELL